MNISQWTTGHTLRKCNALLAIQYQYISMVWALPNLADFTHMEMYSIDIMMTNMAQQLCNVTCHSSSLPTVGSFIGLTS
jgi:hypothetical protein